MENLPKISSVHNETQFRSEINVKKITQKSSQIKKPYTSSQSRNLSPFTWNNLKLPSVILKKKLQKDSSHINPGTIKKLSNTIDFTSNHFDQQIEKINKNNKLFKNSVLNPKIREKSLSNQTELHEQVIKQNQRSKFTSQYQRRKQRISTDQYHQTLKKQKIENNRQQKNNFKAKQQLKRLSEARYDLGTNQGFRFRGRSPKQNHNEQSLNGSIILNSSRNSTVTNSVSLGFCEMQPYVKKYFMKVNDSTDGHKYFITSNPKYRPFQNNELRNKSLSLISNNETQQTKTLIWTRNPNQNIFKQKSEEQYYNHVEGSFILTVKQKLHNIMNGGKGESGFYYPLSFTLPEKYKEFVEEYDWTLVKMTLKNIVTKINEFQTKFEMNNEEKENQKTQENFNVCLSDILDQLIRDTKNQEQIRLLRFCLFLEDKIQKYNLQWYFQKMPTYQPIQIKLTQNIYIDVIQWCLQIKKQMENQNISQFMFQNIDYRLLKLIKFYDRIFTQNIPTYLYKNLDNFQNIWILKPFASSKAAGISLIFSSQQFYTTKDFEYKQFRYKPKFQNKIIMKYLTNPFLIKHSGIDYFANKKIKELTSRFDDEQILRLKILSLRKKVSRFLKLQQKFCNRKFDIRQWILIVCDEQAHQNERKMNENNEIKQKKEKLHKKQTKKFKFYKYHTAYCRFAPKHYDLDSKDLSVHLTNYELYKKQISPVKPQRNSKNEGNDCQLLTAKQKTKKINQKLKRNNSYASESLLMLEQLFQYVEFLEELKSPIKDIEEENNKNFSSNFKDKYQNQMDKILTKVFEFSYKNLAYNKGTFELFGFDFFIDEEMNLFLLQVNLNPGCATERSQKLEKQAQEMLQSMLKTVTKNNEKSYEDNQKSIYELNKSQTNTKHQRKWIEVISKDVNCW